MKLRSFFNRKCKSLVKYQCIFLIPLLLTYTSFVVLVEYGIAVSLASPLLSTQTKINTMYDGDVLQLLRKYKKISQTELAKRIYKSQETISHYEQQEHLNGKNLEQLLQALKSNKVEWNLFKKLPPPIMIKKI